MRGRKHHSQPAVNIIPAQSLWKQPSVEIQHQSMRKYTLVQLSEHVANIMICSFIKAGGSCCRDMLSNFKHSLSLPTFFKKRKCLENKHSYRQYQQENTNSLYCSTLVLLATNLNQHDRGKQKFYCILREFQTQLLNSLFKFFLQKRCKQKSLCSQSNRVDTNSPCPRTARL